MELPDRPVLTTQPVDVNGKALFKSENLGLIVGLDGDCIVLVWETLGAVLLSLCDPYPPTLTKQSTKDSTNLLYVTSFQLLTATTYVSWLCCIDIPQDEDGKLNQSNVKFKCMFCH